jgi:hypothetical protein
MLRGLECCVSAASITAAEIVEAQGQLQHVQQLLGHSAAIYLLYLFRSLAYIGGI